MTSIPDLPRNSLTAIDSAWRVHNAQTARASMKVKTYVVVLDATPGTQKSCRPPALKRARKLRNWCCCP